MEKCYDSSAEMANRSQYELDQVFEAARRPALLSATLSAMPAEKRDTSAVIADPPGIKMEDPSVHLHHLEKEPATWQKITRLVKKQVPQLTSAPWK